MDINAVKEYLESLEKAGVISGNVISLHYFNKMADALCGDERCVEELYSIVLSLGYLITH